MTQWRKEHPKATWQEIETAVDERINQLRAQLIQRLAANARYFTDSSYSRIQSFFFSTSPM